MGCMPSDSVLHSCTQTVPLDILEQEVFQVDPSAHEDEPEDLEVGISIQNLSKIFDVVSFLWSVHERER